MPPFKIEGSHGSSLTLPKDALCDELKKQKAGLLLQIQELSTPTKPGPEPSPGLGNAGGPGASLLDDLYQELRYVEMQIDENCGVLPPVVGLPGNLLYPTLPTITYPDAAKYQEIPVQPTFAWQDGAAGEQNAATYFVLRVSSGPAAGGPWSIVFGPTGQLTSTKYAYSDGLADMSWYLLEVDAWNAAGDSGWSSIAFQTGIATPDTPLIVAPKSGETAIVGVEYLAVWSDPGGQTLHAAAGFEWTLKPPTGASSSGTTPGNMADTYIKIPIAGNYEFQLTATNAAGSIGPVQVNFKAAAAAPIHMPPHHGGGGPPAVKAPTITVHDLGSQNFTVSGTGFPVADASADVYITIQNGVENAQDLRSPAALANLKGGSFTLQINLVTLCESMGLVGPDGTFNVYPGELLHFQAIVGPRNDTTAGQFSNIVTLTAKA